MRNKIWNQERTLFFGMFFIILCVWALLTNGCSHANLDNSSHSERENKSEMAMHTEVRYEQGNAQKTNKVILDQAQEHAMYKGIQAYQQGDYEEAIAVFDHILQEQPHSSRVLSEKAMALALRGEISKALELGTHAYEESPHDGAIAYNLAMINKLNHRLDESKKYFEIVIQKDPHNVWSLYGIATIYADQGNQEAALEYLRRAIAIDASVKAVAREQDHWDKFRGQSEFDRLTQ